jgi:hypothetical protein
MSQVQRRIRTALINNPDGLTTVEIRATTRDRQNSIYPALKLMPDAYIDRWQYVQSWCVQEGKPHRETRLKPVWALSDVLPAPEHCPKPDPEK